MINENEEILESNKYSELETNEHKVVLEFLNNDELIRFLTELASQRKYVFRGYSQQNEMLPKLIRGSDLTKLEIDLLKEFERYGAQYINVKDQIDLLSYAQHFGLSTRLLDFTYNPFIALYFALFKSKPKNANIKDDNDFYYIRFCNFENQILFSCLPIWEGGWGVYKTGSSSRFCEKTFDLLNKIVDSVNNKTNFLNEHNGFFKEIYASFNKTSSIYGKITEDLFVEEMKNKFYKKRLLFVDANQSNQRLIMQQGLYLVPYVLEKDNLTELINNNTSIIRIHKSLRKNLLIYLNTIGINAFRLMPDLSSICEAVERKIKGI